MLASAQQGHALARLGKQHDLTEAQVRDVANYVVPELNYNIERNTLSRGGLADMVQIIGNGGFEQLLSEDADVSGADAIQDGNALLGQILGTKYQSRALADRAERETGIPAAKIRRMLPQFAGLSVGALSEQAKSRFGDIFARFPELQNRPSGGSFQQGQSPLPLPGDNWSPSRPQNGGRTRTQYDDLSDVIRRGGGQPMQSNPLWGIVRTVLGSILGFKSNGITGWIIRFIVYRWGWSILKAIIGRAFRGR